MRDFVSMLKLYTLNYGKYFSTACKEIIVTKPDRLDKTLCRELNISRKSASGMIASDQVTLLPEQNVCTYLLLKI